MILPEIFMIINLWLIVTSQDKFKDTNTVFSESGPVQPGEQLVPAFQRAVFGQPTSSPISFSSHHSHFSDHSVDKDSLLPFTIRPAYDTSRQSGERTVVVNHNTGNNGRMQHASDTSNSRNTQLSQQPNTRKFASQWTGPSNRFVQSKKDLFYPPHLITPVVSSVHSQFQSLNANNRNHFGASKFQNISEVGFRPFIRKSVTNNLNNNERTLLKLKDNQSQDVSFRSTSGNARSNSFGNPQTIPSPSTIQIPKPINYNSPKKFDSPDFRAVVSVNNDKQSLQNDISPISPPPAFEVDLKQSPRYNILIEDFSGPDISSTKKRKFIPSTGANIFSSVTHIPLLPTGNMSLTPVSNLNSINSVSYEETANWENSVNPSLNNKTLKSKIATADTVRQRNHGVLENTVDNGEYLYDGSRHTEPPKNSSKSSIYNIESADRDSIGNDNIPRDLISSSSSGIPTSTPSYDYYEYLYYYDDQQNTNYSILDYESLNEDTSEVLSDGVEIENTVNRQATIDTISKNLSFYISEYNSNDKKVEEIKYSNRTSLQYQLKEKLTQLEKSTASIVQPVSTKQFSQDTKHAAGSKENASLRVGTTNLTTENPSLSKQTSLQKYPKSTNRLASLLKQQLTSFSPASRSVNKGNNLANSADKFEGDYFMTKSTTENVFHESVKTLVYLDDSAEANIHVDGTIPSTVSSKSNSSNARTKVTDKPDSAKYTLLAALNRGVTEPVSQRPTIARAGQKAGLFSLFEKLRHQKTQNVNAVIASVRKGKQLTSTPKRRVATRRPVLSSLSQYKKSVAKTTTVTNYSGPATEVSLSTPEPATSTISQNVPRAIGSGGFYNQLASIIASLPSGFQIQSVQTTASKSKHSPSIASSPSLLTVELPKDSSDERAAVSTASNDGLYELKTSKKIVNVHAASDLDSADGLVMLMNANKNANLKLLTTVKPSNNVPKVGANLPADLTSVASTTLPARNFSSREKSVNASDTSSSDNKKSNVRFDEALVEESGDQLKGATIVTPAGTAMPSELLSPTLHTPAPPHRSLEHSAKISTSSPGSLLYNMASATPNSHSSTLRPRLSDILENEASVSNNRSALDESRGGYFNRSNDGKYNEGQVLSTQCSSHCRIGGTMRVVDGLTWSDQLSSPTSRPWLAAAAMITEQLTEAFTQSSMAVWFDRIQVVSFRRGSVVVDYKIYFNNLAGRLTTRDILRLFRQNLLLPSIPPLATGRLENSTGELLQLGKLIIDAAYTYFYVLESSDVQLASGVISDSALTHDSEQPSKYLIPEWLIAAIVVGMTALLFMVVFAVLVLWSRRKRTRLRSTVPLTIDMLDQLDKAGRMQPPVAGISGDPVDPSSVDPYVDDGDDAWDDSKVRQRQYRRCLSKARLSPLTTSVDSSVYDSWGSDCSVAGRRPRVLRTTRAMAPGTDSDEF